METIPDWAQDAPSVPDWAQPNPRDFIKPAPGELVNPVSTKSRLGAGTQLLPTAKDISNALPDAETVHEVAADVTRPAVALPKFTVNPNDSKVMAVAKSAANLGISLPEFAESPLGVATMGAGSVMPRVVAALFAADTGRNVKQQASELGSQWDTLTPAQKAAALTDITGNTLLTATLGHGATKGRVTPSDVQLEAKPLPDTPVNPVVQAVKPTPPPVEAASPDALAGLQTAMRQRQLAPKPPVQPSAATGGTLTPPPAESVPTGNVGANKAIQGATPIDTINKVAAMTPQELSAAFPMGPNNLTASAWRLGQSLTKPEELQALKAAQANAKGFEGQFFREAYEAATGTGSAGYALSKDPKYQPPFPVTDNPPTVKEGGSPAKDAPVSAGGNAGNLSNPAGEKVSSLPIKSNENESSPRSSAIPQPSQPAPASPVKSALIRQGTGELVKDRTDEQWNILHENLIDDLDSYHSARNTGSVDYDLRDNLAKFMEEARKNNGDMTMGEAWKSFKGQLSDSHAKKIQSALKNQGVDLTTSKARQGTGESPKLEKVKTGSVDTPAQGSLNQALKLKADTWKRVQSIRQKIKANPIQTGNLRVDLIKAESAHREALQMERDARAGIETRANEQGQTTKPNSHFILLDPPWMWTRPANRLNNSMTKCRHSSWIICPNRRSCPAIQNSSRHRSEPRRSPFFSKIPSLALPNCPEHG